MHDPPRILIVDDNEANRDILDARLKVHGYDLLQAVDGEEALVAARQHLPDLILLDVMMPKLDGFEVCRRLKGDASLPFMPIILVTAKTASTDVVEGLDAGADEYLTKPIDQAALVARVRSVLRIKALHDQVQAQAADLATWNRTLEQRVTDQVAEIERVGRLKRFLAPQIAELVISSGDGRVLESHRRDISVVFCDLRGFTAFAESTEPEEVMTVLREYHATLGTIVRTFEGTLERFTGDGVMVLFNDPLPCPDPPRQALRMAIEMRRCVGDLSVKWRKYGHDLGFDAAGELLIRGECLFSGYWRDPEATAAAFAEGGWYRTGDIGLLTADRYLYILDRAKDMIISGGENIYPAEVEAVLARHPGVAEAAVVGMPDPTWGEAVHAVIIPRPGSSASAEEIIAWCRDELAHFKCPRTAEFADSLPRTTTGKVLKRELRAQLAAWPEVRP